MNYNSISLINKFIIQFCHLIQYILQEILIQPLEHQLLMQSISQYCLEIYQVFQYMLQGSENQEFNNNLTKSKFIWFIQN